MEFCGCQIPPELEVGTSLVNLGQWGLMPVCEAGVVGKKFGIFLFKLLPSERLLGFLLHSSLQCGSRKCLSSKMGGSPGDCGK